MKKFTIAIVALAALVALSSPLFAEGKMMFGVKGGLNLANIIGEDVENNSMKVGFAGGVFMCYNLTEIFAIQPELLYSMKGVKYEAGILEVNQNLNYFEIPLLLKVNLPTEGKIKPSLYAGPALGILMSAEVEDLDVKDYMKGTDFGIIAGAALGYQMESGMLFGEFRYEVGLSTIWDLSDEELAAADLTEQPDEKNSVISILVGYGFAF
jgi:hypothetical protein